MSTLYKVPFRSNCAYSFTSNCGGNNFKFHIKHNISDDTYFMDIDMLVERKYKPIIQCVNLTCGSDLFISYKRYGLGTLMIIPTDKNYYDKVPQANTILSKFVMMWEHD